MNKLLALAVVAATAASADAFAAETTCTAAPSCSELGYTQSASVCSGKYIKCPFDTTKVMCVNGGPHVGDLKYSLYSSNHDGWLLCNGTVVNKANYPKLYNLLGTKFCHRYTSRTDTAYSSFSSDNCDTSKGEFALPDYRGFFLRGVMTYNSYLNTVNKPVAGRTPSSYYSDALYYKGYASTLSSMTGIAVPQYEQLPNIKGNSGVAQVFAGDTQSTGAIIMDTYNRFKNATGNDKTWWGESGWNFDASKSSPIYDGSHVMPASYGAYIFIYAGE